MAEADPGGCLVSMAEVSTSEVSELSAGVTHLLAADEALNPGWGSSRITLCGEEVRAGDASLTSVTHCPSCECVPRFCPERVQEASQWSAES
jgi:hypothetical protein